MKNIIQTMSGATVTLKREGNILLVFIEGKAGQVYHAVTLLYNYGAFDSFPEYVDDETTSMMYKTPLRTFAQGLVAMYRNALFDESVRRCKRNVQAILRASRDVRAMLPVKRSLESMTDETDLASA